MDFGKGAKTLAGKLAAGGSKVAMIEKDAGMYGGTASTWAVFLLNLWSEVQAWRLSRQKLHLKKRLKKYRLAIEEKRRLTDMLRRKNYGKLADNPNIDVILGKASFCFQYSGADCNGSGNCRH